MGILGFGWFVVLFCEQCQTPIPQPDWAFWDKEDPIMGDILQVLFTRTDSPLTRDVSAFLLGMTEKMPAWWQRAGPKVVVGGVRSCLSHPSLYLSHLTLSLISFLSLLPHSLDLVLSDTEQTTGAFPTKAATALA